MFDSLFQLHEIPLFIFLCGFGVIFSTLAVFLVKWLVPLKLRYMENPVLGNMSALISIIYGVLAGLTALYLINTYSDTTSAVQHEANAVANVYRDSQWLQEPARIKVQTQIQVYLERVINVEWPLMRVGARIDRAGDSLIDAISTTLYQYPVSTKTDLLIVRDLLDEIKTLYNARQKRIAASYAQLNPEFWVVIGIGTFLVIMINYLYGMNFYLHLMTVSAATVMALSMIFLLIALDRPFQGEYVIESDAFKPLLMHIKSHNTG